MFKKFNSLIILLLLFISISAVSAVDDGDMNLTSDNDDLDIEEVSDVSDDVLSYEYNIDSEKSSDNQITINNEKYSQYFDADGLYKGDYSDIILSGSFSSKNFKFNKTVNVSNGQLYNSMITFLSGASGSTITGVKITNSIDVTYGIFLNSASNCIIQGCTITNQGKSSYPICLGNDANYNNVTDNVLTTSGADYGHGTRSTPTLLISGSHYNYIANNKCYVDDANAIYLSSYPGTGGSPLKGGVSNFNVIYNNSISYNVLPTSWSFGIQLMGNNNTVRLNTIRGAYTGISTGDNYGNKIIENTIINVQGKNYNNNQKSGGWYGINVGSNSEILNNYIINASCSLAGIQVADNCIVENNYIEVITEGKGISIIGENGLVKNNVIFTNSGSGIYQNKNVPGLFVSNNNITSAIAVGILIESENSKSMPFNVTIINNVINTTNQYAIDAKGVDKSSNWIVDDSNKIIGKGSILTPEGVFDPSKPNYKFEGNTIYINESNAHVYINANGGLVDINNGDTLVFCGEFNDQIIIVNKEIKITGNNATFYNSSFKITSPGVQIENLTIINKKANRANAWGIFVNKVEGVRIFNNNIEVNDPNAAYAIYVLGSTYAEIIGNNLTSSGDYLTFTLLIYESSDCILSNNKIVTIGTSINYNFDTGLCIDGDEVCLDGETICIDGGEVCLDGETICIDGDEVCLDGEISVDDRFSVAGAHTVPEIYRTYGILMIGSSYTNVTGNRVLATSKVSKTIDNSTNAVVGIDAYFNSHYNIFSNNNVFISAKDKYIYGMGVLGQDTMAGIPKGQGGNNNTFINNNINLDGTYYSCGIIIGYASTDTLISDNHINLTSNVSYGVYLEISQKSIVKNNEINSTSDVGYGISLYESNNNVIDNNTIKANGKQVYGMAISGNNNVISNNVINSNGTGENIYFPNHDSLGYGNAGIFLSGNSTNNNLKSNNIASQIGYAIDSQSSGNTFEDNYFVTENIDANNAINGKDGNNIIANYIYFINATFPDFTSVYLEEATFILYANSTLDGATVKFYQGIDLIGKTSIKEGVAVFKCILPNDYTPGLCPILAIVSKENYKTTEFDSILTITEGNLNVNVNNMSVKPGINAKYEVKVTNALQNPVSGLTVNFYYFSSSSQIAFSGKTDKNGVLTIIKPLDEGYSIYDNVEVFIEVEESDYYLSVQAISNIKVLDIAPVSIKINDKVGFNGVLTTLNDNNGLPIVSKEVTVNVDGKSVNVKTNANGEVILPSVSAGSHSITVSSAKDANYDAASVNSKVTVVASISGNANANVFYGNTVQYKIRIADKNGNYLGANNVITIKVNGKAQKLKTDKNGYVTYTVKNVGTYTITAEYNGQKVSNKIVIKPTLSAKNIAKKKAKKIKFSVKLVDKKGKVLKNKKVTFKVKGKKYTAKTNKKGVATVTLKNLKVGKYSITSSYGGCTISNKITVKK